MERRSVRLSLPADLLTTLKERANVLGIPLSHLVSQLCEQGLGLSTPAPPSLEALNHEVSSHADRLRDLETQVAQVWQHLAVPKLEARATPPADLQALPAPTPPPDPDPLPTLDWDPVTHDFDSWLLTIWLHFATDADTGEIRWGSPVSADHIHAMGFRILRKQAFLDRLASSEAPGLLATSWDPDQPELSWIHCRIHTVIFANPAALPD